MVTVCFLKLSEETLYGIYSVTDLTSSRIQLIILRGEIGSLLSIGSLWLLARLLLRQDRISGLLALAGRRRGVHLLLVRRNDARRGCGSRRLSLGGDLHLIGAASRGLRVPAARLVRYTVYYPGGSAHRWQRLRGERCQRRKRGEGSAIAVEQTQPRWCASRTTCVR